MGKIKKSKQMLGWFMITLGIVIIISLFVYKLFQYKLVPEYMIDAGWMEYLGAIFGGLLGGGITFAGVWWTIRSGDIKWKAERKNNIKPFLIYAEHKNTDQIFSQNNIYFDCNQNSRCQGMHLPILLKNIGLGAATSIQVFDAYMLHRRQENITRSNPVYHVEKEGSLFLPISIYHKFEKDELIEWQKSHQPQVRKVKDGCRVADFLEVEICYLDVLGTEYKQTFSIDVFIRDEDPIPQMTGAMGLPPEEIYLD